MIWDSVRRPAFETRYASFEDVSEESEGHMKLTWAKRRKIIDDIPRFRPDEPMTFADALIWIYRTRNVAEVTDMERQDLSDLRRAYPLGDSSMSLDAHVTQSRLMNLMADLDARLAKEVHTVSYYADDFHGKGTAFGETFDMHALTAAHRTLPQDTLVKVTNVDNGKHVVVRINDRGPYAENRGMDLSRAAFEKIAPLSRGVINATFLRIGDTDLVDECSDSPSMYQKRITRDVRFHRGVPHAWNVGEPFTLGSTRYFVVRWMQFPDGTRQRVESWIGPEEKFTFTPSRIGTYRFRIGNAIGRSREFFMHVNDCKSE